MSLNKISNIHRNYLDSIVGRKLEGSSRKITPIKDVEPIIIDNTCIFLIERIGGKKASCIIKKKTDLKLVFKDISKLKIFTEIGEILEGNSIYCECEDGERRRISRFSASHGGQIGIFKSKKVSLATIFKEFAQTKEYKLTSKIKIGDFKKEIMKN